MREIQFLIIIFLFSCVGQKVNDVKFEDRIKWDFYKKNTLKYFQEDTLKIPFYQTSIRITQVEKSTDNNLNCYYGEFFESKYSLSSKYAGNISVPAVYSICYDSTQKVSKYYLGDYAVIENPDEKKEKEEDEKLKSIIEKEAVCSFLKNFQY